MSTPKTRKRELSPDSAGRYRPYVGWKIIDGKRVQHRFNLGTDRQAAERRLTRIRELYQDDLQNNLSDNLMVDKSCWSDRGLILALEIASGATAFQIAPPLPAQAIEYQQGIEQQRRSWPAANVQPADLEAYATSGTLNQKLVSDRIAELQAELKRMGALLAGNSLPAKLVAGTFHEALDAYAADYTANAATLEDGDEKPNTFKERERCEALKKSHPDFPLYELDRDRIDKLFAHWRARPITKRKTRSSHDTAEHKIKQLDRFFRWLDGTAKYDWQMPRGFDSISRKIEKLNSDRNLSAMVKPSYAPAELAHLSATATDWQRLALYCGLNFGMGAAELGRLTVDDFKLREPHPFAKEFHIETSKADCYLRYFRPKTFVFGEFWIWPETLELVEWGIARAKKLGNNILFCRESGNPLYEVKSKNPQQGFANVWGRMHEQAGIPKKKRLPFGSIRDTLPDHMRATYDSELASMLLTHGIPKGTDKLIDCYANKPWARYHEAVKQSYSYYAPLWAVHKSPE